MDGIQKDENMKGFCTNIITGKSMRALPVAKTDEEPAVPPMGSTTDNAN
jgi:hypothetical protein